jgi:hypothetical protein
MPLGRGRFAMGSSAVELFMLMSSLLGVAAVGLGDDLVNRNKVLSANSEAVILSPDYACDN